MTDHDAESLEQVIDEQAREIARLQAQIEGLCRRVHAAHEVVAACAERGRVCARCREAFAIEDLEAHGGRAPAACNE